MSTAKKKGGLVEQIAANFHDMPGVKVEKNVMLPPCSGKGRPREIDVLLTSTVAGYPVRFAIECKNEAQPIEAPRIDSFIGKLQYLGIPSQHGIYISASRYTLGAKERAAAASIKLLNLTGLSHDRLSAAVFGSLQSVVYLCLKVREITVTNTCEEHIPLRNIFFNANGEFSGTLYDPIYFMWCRGEFPSELGIYERDVDIPEGWYQDVGGRLERPLSMRAKVQIVAFVINIEGKTTQHALVNTDNQNMEKWHLHARFDDHNAPTTVKQVETEEELAVYLDKPERVHLKIGRLLLPRILAFSRYGYMYWPPREATMLKMKEMADTYGIEDEIPPNILQEHPLEDNNLNVVFEPFWEGYTYEYVPL